MCLHPPTAALPPLIPTAKPFANAQRHGLCSGQRIVVIEEVSVKLKSLPPVLSLLPALASPLFAVAALGQTTGVSRPEESPERFDAATTAQAEHYVKPSHANAAPVSYPTSYAATGPAPSAPAESYPAANHTPALIVREPAAACTLPSTAPTGQSSVETAGLRSERGESTDHGERAPHAGDDDGIVLSVPQNPHELNLGTVLKARLTHTVSTETTHVGAPFSAELIGEVARGGEVFLPAGSVIHGRVTAIHGGKRIGGLAAIRLRPDSVTLPDGTRYVLHASVSDVEGFDDIHVNDEGVIQPRTYPKTTLAVLGGTTATAAVAGALIGGGVGAVVGAGIGAGVGAYWWLNRDHQETLPPGSTLYFSLDEPLELNPR